MVVTVGRAHAGFRASGAIVAALAALAACGTGAVSARSPQLVIPPLVGTEPNGEQLRTGAQLIADARTSLAGAETVHLSGSLMLQGVSTPLDVISDRDGDVTGSLGGTKGALQIQFSRSAGEVYVRPTGDATALVAQLGLPTAVSSAAPDGDFWNLDATDASSVMSLTSLGLPALISNLLPASLSATPSITSGDVDGTPVVIAKFVSDSSAYETSTELAGAVAVAVTGDARLVRLTGGADDATLDVEVGTAAPPPLPTPAATPNP